MTLILCWLVALFLAAAVLLNFIESRNETTDNSAIVCMLFSSGIVSPIFLLASFFYPNL